MLLVFQKVIVLLALTAGLGWTVNACDAHDHDHSQDHDHDHHVNGLSSELHGRQAKEVFRVGKQEYASRLEWAAEGKRCQSADLTPTEARQVAQRLRSFENNGGRRRLQGTTITIPTYIHIIRDNAGTAGGVTSRQIIDQIDVLNAAFVPQFAFELQGIDSTSNTAWLTATVGTAAEAAMKNALRKGDTNALNVYFTDPNDGALGWATLPFSVRDSPTALARDGVVLRYDSVPGGIFAPYNLGDTAVHECGHWLGLSHTFKDGCSAVNDGVTDTPAEATPAFGCPIGRDTCPSGGLDPINNYMDYVDDSCMDRFTNGQESLMLSEFEAFRLRPDENGNPIPEPTPTAPTPTPPSVVPNSGAGIIVQNARPRPTPSPPSPSPPSFFVQNSGGSTPTPPISTPATPTPPSPSFFVQNSGPTPNNASVPTPATGPSIVVQNSKPQLTSGSSVESASQKACVGSTETGGQCRINRQCCSGSCSSRVCVE